MDKNELVILVQKAQNKDNTAMEELFSEYYNDVYYFALKTLKDADLACDITQDTFLEVVKTIDKLKEPAAFKKWLKMVTYHQCTRYFRKKKEILVSEDEDGNTIFDEIVDDDESVVPAQVYENEEFQSTIMGMVNELSEEQRSAVMLYYFDELSISEIAQIQGVSEGTVKSRLNYARKGIKKSVESYEEKHQIKLHAIPFLPIIKLGFGATEALTGASLIAVKTAVAEAAASMSAGITATVATTTATSTGASSTGAKVSGGIMAKIAALPIFTKVIAGVVAAALAIGGVAISLEPDVPVNTNRKTISTSRGSGIIVVHNDGTCTLDYLEMDEYNGIPIESDVVNEVEQWEDIVEVAAGKGFYLGLKSDGTVNIAIDSDRISSPDNFVSMKQEVASWTNIVTIAADMEKAAALNANGYLATITYSGTQWVYNGYDDDLVAIDGSFNDSALMCLTKKGKIESEFGPIFYTDLSEWKNIVKTDSTNEMILALDVDGNVKHACYEPLDELDTWTDMIDISCSSTHIVGLKSDGTVVATPYIKLGGVLTYNDTSETVVKEEYIPQDKGQYDVENWTDIVAVEAGEWYTLGLKKDGTLLIAGESYYFQAESGELTDIKLPTPRE